MDNSLFTYLFCNSIIGANSIPNKKQDREVKAFTSNSIPKKVIQIINNTRLLLNTVTIYDMSKQYYYKITSSTTYEHEMKGLQLDPSTHRNTRPISVATNRDENLY